MLRYLRRRLHRPGRTPRRTRSRRCENTNDFLAVVVLLTAERLGIESGEVAHDMLPVAPTKYPGSCV